MWALSYLTGFQKIDLHPCMELSGSVDSEFSFPLSCNSALLSSVVLTKEKYSSRHFPQEA